MLRLFSAILNIQVNQHKYTNFGHHDIKLFGGNLHRSTYAHTLSQNGMHCFQVNEGENTRI